MSRSIALSVEYPHPPAKVWQAITSREALNVWLMPNDFEPRLGHRFQFRTNPSPGFDGIINCEVLQLDPPRTLAFSWVGGPLQTRVTFSLEPIDGGAGTRLNLRHEGFDTLKKRLIGSMLRSGWKRMLRRRLPATLEHLAADGGLVGGSAAALEQLACRKGPFTRMKVALIGLVPGRRA